MFGQRGVFGSKNRERDRTAETYRIDGFERRPQEGTEGLDQKLKRESSRLSSPGLKRKGGGDSTLELVGAHGGER